MNRSYARRLWLEGKWPCLITSLFLLVCNGLLLTFGGHSELFRTNSGSVLQSSAAEIGLGLVTLGLPVLVLVLSLRGLAAEYGRGSLLDLAVQAPSRRELVFTLWAVRALQIAAVLFVSLAPCLFAFPLRMVAGAFLWVFIQAFGLFALIELFGMLLGGLWRGVLLLFPGLWALQVSYSILQRSFHWRFSEPLSYAQNHWLFVPVLASADTDLSRAVIVSACWFLACLIPAVFCAEWLQHAEIRGKRF